ncbi:MAG TPA: serine/threonine-protein kinase [Candidatus Dormibacteraeota bacterium]|nr:serine/threonine-protein kinase [Candidatus Dormibacteraeota bacterium]
MEGSRVGRYVLEDCLGHGSHTAVYRAWAPAGEWCALKLVDTQVQGSDDLADRLRRDAALIEQAGHTHILPIYNPMRSDHLTAAAMPLMNGPTLHDLMQNGGLDPDSAWSVLSQVAESLDSAHQRGLTYRVLKPSNILISDGRAYLSEFGITGRYTGQFGLTIPDCRLPAAQYLAPEQVLGREPDHRSDVYAFAVLVFELATATALHGDVASSAILERTLKQTPPSAHERNALVPPEVDGVLRRALSRDPGARQRSAGELIEELACPPSPAQPAPGGGGDDDRPFPPVSADGDLSVESLIDVLSGVLSPEDGQA